MIPQIIHRIWIGDPEPAWMQPYEETWLDHHPGWSLFKWDNKSVSQMFPLYNQELYDRAHQLFPRQEYQFKSDLLRYEILHKYGGMYVDADFYCLRNMEDLIEGCEWFAVWELQDQWIANGLMGATPQHDFIANLMTGLNTAVDGMDPGMRPAQVSGPRYVSRMYRGVTKWEGNENLRVLPQRLFFPYGHRDVRQNPIDKEFDDPELYAVHVWHNRRRERGLLPA